jgi:glycosyltransferase involved in cell wall biosynthesis
VTWVGPLEVAADYRSVFRRASAFILPSEWEAFGLVLLEAMAAGVPVIASAVGGVPELLGDGQFGRLVNYGDIPALAEALREVAVQPDRLEGIREAGRQRVRQFDWNRTATAFRKLYSAAVAG